MLEVVNKLLEYKLQSESNRQTDKRFNRLLKLLKPHQKKTYEEITVPATAWLGGGNPSSG